MFFPNARRYKSDLRSVAAGVDSRKERRIEMGDLEGCKMYAVKMEALDL